MNTWWFWQQFWQDCSEHIEVVQIQTRALAAIRAASCVRCPRSCLRSRTRAKQALQTFTAWQENDKSESNQTPRFLTASVGDIRLPSMLTGKFFALRLRVKHNEFGLIRI